MAEDPSIHGDRLSGLIKRFQELSEWNKTPGEFWNALTDFLCQLSGGSRGMTVMRQREQGSRWKKIADVSLSSAPAQIQSSFLRHIENAAGYCIQEGQYCERIQSEGKSNEKNFILVGIPLKLQGDQSDLAVLFLVEENEHVSVKELLLRLHLASALPDHFQRRRSADDSRKETRKFGLVLDLLAVVNAETDYLAALLALCNGIVTHFKCQRASLGWLDGNYVKLSAMSGMERFDRKMEASQMLESAMEECLDQNDWIVWPDDKSGNKVSNCHATFAKDQGAGHICSVPVRLNQEPLGVVTFERTESSFSDEEVQQLMLTVELLAPRLNELRKRSRWIGARAKDSLEDGLKWCLGPKNSWIKLVGILGTVTLLLLIFLKLPYRVEANFILRSEKVSYVTSPFAGYIEEVHVRAGDEVSEGLSLLVLDTDELLLQQSSAIAELNRYTREAEKARAERQLAEMNIAAALAEQAQARLEIISWRLDRANLKAPFDGVVVEADLRERLGSPVEEGEPLVRIAYIGELYVEAEASERDLDDLINSTDGEIAFVSQPKLKFPVQIERFESAAFPRTSENVFRVRCLFQEEPESWFRPGMSGVAKLNAGKRSMLWILTHRTVDFLRMFFWW